MKTELENANFNQSFSATAQTLKLPANPLSKLLVSLIACGASQSIFHVAGFVFV
jgi:hypothetical protein